MSAVPHHGAPGFLASALARVDDWLFEKVPAAAPVVPPLATYPRVVVAGAGPRVGASTVARALAVELAARADGGAIVTAGALPPRAAPAARAARRIAAAFGDRPLRVTGRLCLVEPDPNTAAAALYLAPLVVDWPYGEPVVAAARLEAPVILVATPTTDRALVDAVAAQLPGAVLVCNRHRGEVVGGICVPEARLHARLALAGRPVTGRFGTAIAALAERVT